MLEGGGEPLLGRGGEPRGPAGDEVPGLREDPGIAERAPGDHDPGAVRVGPHRDDVFRGGDVAVPDDRDVEGLDDAADLVPVRRTGEHLRPGAGVQREGLGAGLAAALRNGNGIALRLVPAAPDLDGDGEMRCTSHRPDDARDQIEILQAARSAVVLDDLFDRAAEVDVDEVGPAGLGDHLGGTGQDRKSTRLNSSHGYISYAVFCLKKKKY